MAIIDDDASLRRSLSNLLGPVGFRVETFVSAEVFLESPIGRACGLGRAPPDEGEVAVTGAGDGDRERG